MKIRPAPRCLRLAMALVTLAAGTAAHADDDSWWIHTGVGRVTFYDSSTLIAAGSVVPGAGAKASDNTALIFETGYRLTPQWSASATFGVPPVSVITGTGSAAPFGTMGEIKYGPLVLAAQYRFGEPGAVVRPYLGAGAVYYIVLESRDAAIQQLNSHIMFQQLNLAAQRRLRHVQPFGSPAEMQFLGDGNKATQLADFEHGAALS